MGTKNKSDKTAEKPKKSIAKRIKSGLLVAAFAAAAGAGALSWLVGGEYVVAGTIGAAAAGFVSMPIGAAIAFNKESKNRAFGFGLFAGGLTALAGGILAAILADQFNVVDADIDKQTDKIEAIATLSDEEAAAEAPRYEVMAP